MAGMGTPALLLCPGEQGNKKPQLFAAAKSIWPAPPANWRGRPARPEGPSQGRHSGRPCSIPAEYGLEL